MFSLRDIEFYDCENESSDDCERIAHKRNSFGGDLGMSKNTIICALAIVIAILTGFLILTNYGWLSQEWLIGLSMILGGIASFGLLVYVKIKK